jgi:hypothetical protein
VIKTVSISSSSRTEEYEEVAFSKPIFFPAWTPCSPVELAIVFKRTPAKLNIGRSIYLAN